MRKEALKNVSEYNKELNTQKVKAFFEHHTKLKFYPGNRFKKLKPEYTRPAPYPVALLQGQYTTYYKKFSPEEMRQMPIQTVLENERLFPFVKKGTSPPPITVTEQELQKKIDDDKAKEKRFLYRQGSDSHGGNQSTPLRVLASINARRQSNVSRI